MTIATIRHEVGRKIFAFTWGKPQSYNLLGHTFRFGRLHGAWGLRGFTLWFRTRDGICYDVDCKVLGFYSLNTNRTYCNKHVTPNARD